MTTFNPKIALRILEAKQKRLDIEAYGALRYRLQLESANPWFAGTPGWHELKREFDVKIGHANAMYDVLDYLRNRIEEEA